MLQTPILWQESKKPLTELITKQINDWLSPPVNEFADWQSWLNNLFPVYTSHEFADRHVEFWEWVESIKYNVRPRPFVAIWPRGGAKSTSAELACVRVGAKDVRRYIWYCCSVQEQADKHVETIGSMLESHILEKHHPNLSERQLGKYGHSKGWRRQRLRTRSGLTIDAIGLDTATRGAKIEEQRPDLIVFDDLDDKHDSLKTVTKKIDTITTSILPAGASSLAVLFVQNLIHTGSIASKLSNNETDILVDKIVSGPFPAINNLSVVKVTELDGTIRTRIISGEPTWSGQDIEICQSQIDTWGYQAFLQEAQHEVTDIKGGVYDDIEFRHCNLNQVPEIKRGCVWVDPAVTSTDGSDCQGIQADGLGVDGIIYRFFSWEHIASPEKALSLAIRTAISLRFEIVGVETDQGGDVWIPAYQHVCESLKADDKYPEITKQTKFPSFQQAKAGQGHGSKVHRSSRMLLDYEHGKIVHIIGTHDVLEKALKRFPNDPLDLADVAYWGWWWLREGVGWSRGAKV